MEDYYVIVSVPILILVSSLVVWRHPWFVNRRKQAQEKK